MGIFGNDTKKIDGENFFKEGDFEDEGEAKHWAQYYRNYGFKCRVIPNASSQRFEIWKSEFPTSGAGAPPVPQQ